LQYYEVLPDTINFRAYLANLYMDTVTDLFTLEGLTPVDISVIGRSLIDTLELGESLSTFFGGSLSDTLQLQESVNSLGIQNATIAEALWVSEVFRLSYYYGLTDTVELSETTTYERFFEKMIQDKVEFIENVNALGSYNITLQDAVDLLEAVGYGFAGTIKDNINWTEALACVPYLNNMVQDTVDLATTSAPTVGVYLTKTNRLNIGDNMNSQALLGELIADSVEFIISFSDGDETYIGMTLNTKHRGVTEYTDFNYSSVHRVGGRYIASNSSGIYELKGNTDDGAVINWKLKTGTFNPGDGVKSTLTEAFIGVRLDGIMVFKVVTADQKEYWYEAQSPRAGLDNTRVKFGKGAKSVYWQVEMVNKDGAVLEELEYLDLTPIKLTRRV